METQNPSVPTLVSGMKSSPNVACLDASCSSIDDVKQAIDVAGAVIVENSVLSARRQPQGEVFYSNVEHRASAAHFISVCDVIFESRKPLLVLAGNYDLHSELGGGLSESELQRLHALIWPYVDQPISRTQVLDGPYFEAWMDRLLDPLENWKRITSLVPVQIEYTHMLAPTEIRMPMRRKIWDTAVPGVQYVTRRIARQSAKEAGLSIAPTAILDNAVERVTRNAIKFRPLSGPGHRARFYLRRENMLRLLGLSGSAFVCGAGYEYLVRKFLEVPALGVPMIAFPVDGLAKLGFEPNVHYVATDPESFGYEAASISQDDVRRSRISRAGQTLVAQLHTTNTRIADLVHVTSATVAGSAEGGRFMGGRLRSLD